MKKTRLTRLIAAFLSLMTLGSAFSATAIAATEGESAKTETDQSSTLGYDIADVRDLLNAEVYADYAERNSNVPRATKPIVINAVDYNAEATDAEVKVEDGNLYTPNSGTVAWDVEIHSTAKYALKIEYNFPQDGK